MRKTKLPLHQGIINASMATTVIADAPTSIEYTDNVSIQFNFTGAPVGTFVIELSSDRINWVPLTLPTTPVAAGAPGTVLLDLNQMSADFIRYSYVPTSGTGTLNAYISVKGI